ncbi:hypothetical protein [Micromonospora sp. 4G55]|uniref:hypothetical protein n=1 Tax=Micromonospora sp. 4G55 TaxID=2806102 RepID=UPI001A4456D3|nr:hypothetical protein [Micromonospora sp. 4G55]MBM0256965.1 hypothetical protein [Micromonospora sp. 4G55]
MSFQTSALILSWIAILLLALVVSGLVRQVHALSTGTVGRPGSVGLRPGSPAPRFRDLAPPSPATLVLLFLDPAARPATNCSTRPPNTPDGPTSCFGSSTATPSRPERRTCR